MRLPALGTAIVVCALFGTGVLGSVLTNGDFESGNFDYWTPAGYSDVVSHEMDPRLTTVDGSTYAARLGQEAQAVHIIGDPDPVETSIKRTLDPGSAGGVLSFVYNLYAWSAILSGQEYDNYQAMSVTLNGQEILSVDAPAEYDRTSMADVYESGWQEFTYVLPSTSDPVELAFYNTESGTDVPYAHGAWLYLDNVGFAPAPECPPALLISVVGAFGWGVRRLRRSSRV